MSAVSTENKGWWVNEWRSAEEAFVNTVCPHLGLDIIINPAKEENPYAPDLLVNGKQLGDLKCQRAPFFSSARYKMNPQTCVTFNRKDYERYSRKYPGIIIYFWVRWETLSYEFENGRSVHVWPMRGVWRSTLDHIGGMIDAGAPLHAYKRRVDDTNGNAKDSYLLDLNRMTCLARA